MNFLKNLYYFEKTGVGFTILFFINPLIMTFDGVSEDGEISIWITSTISFLVIYGIPANFFANRSKKKIKKPIKKAEWDIEKSLGSRLVEEVKQLKKDEYDDWNKKNDIHFDKVKNYVIDKLTKLNQSSIDQVKRIDKKILKLHRTIKDEKSTTSEILKRHPFIKTLKEIQNRSK